MRTCEVLRPTWIERYPFPSSSSHSLARSTSSKSAAEIVLSFHLDVFGVFPLVDVGIKRLGLACRRQVLGELPGLEDRLDLGYEGISNRPKVKVQTAK